MRGADIASKSSNELLLVSSRPRTKHAHWQFIDGRGQLFIANGSQLFDVDSEVISQLESAVVVGDDAVEAVLRSIGFNTRPIIDDVPISSPPLHALSLAVAQKCNLGCTYCYASEGSFRQPAKNMTIATAFDAIDLLVHSPKPGAKVNLAFLGGEPLANRSVIRQATERLAKLAAERGLTASYSITTNGTLLTEEDAEFFEKHGFSVTVSLDGPREEHDRQRPFKGGLGSFDRIMQRIQPLLKQQRRMQVSARVTVTPQNLRLRETLDQFLAMGFHSVGFSPVLHSPSGRSELRDNDFADLLDGMIECGFEFERRVGSGERYAFANVINALRELNRGTHRPYPCGAGAGYLGVSADGDLAACHRFVGDRKGALGDVASGVDLHLQNQWLAERHVHRQLPCTQCWARYLCSGGCHHEVIAGGRMACDFIRGWIHYCLGAHSRILKTSPGWFDRISPAPHELFI